LLDGGNELETALKYGWLMASTRLSRLGPANADRLLANRENEETIHLTDSGLLRKGFSFQIQDRYEPSKEAMEGWLPGFAFPPQVNYHQTPSFSLTFSIRLSSSSYDLHQAIAHRQIPVFRSRGSHPRRIPNGARSTV
jgi:hypothetical protein